MTRAYHTKLLRFLSSFIVLTADQTFLESWKAKLNRTTGVQPRPYL